MVVLTLPSSIKVASMQWGPMKAGVQFASPYNGTPQAVDFVADRWLLTIVTGQDYAANAGAYEAFFGRLAGGVNRLRTHHLNRVAPVGTMRGSPTLAVSAARGDSQIQIQTTAGATVKMGDLVGAGGQLFMAAADATANGSGLLVMPVVLRVRAAIASGTAVVWDKPTADFAMPAMSSRFAHERALLGTGQFELVEVW